MALDLILVRHGQSQYNVDQTGGFNAPLTDLGRMQARRAGAYLASRFAIEALYASPLDRTRETAQLINTFLGLPEIVYYDGLMEEELYYGDGFRLFDSPRAAFAVQAPVPPPVIAAYYAQFQARVMRAVNDILARHDEGQIAVVAHAGTLGTIIRSLVGSHHFSLHTENTALHILKWEDHHWHIVSLNRVEHLLSPTDLVVEPDLAEKRRE